MKRLLKRKKLLLIMMVCTTLAVPGSASAAIVGKVLVNGDVFTPGSYSLDLDLTGKSKYVEFRVVNGDGDVKTMVSSVKITMGSGADQIVVISPSQFRTREVSNVVGTLGEEVVKGMGSISVDVRVGGSKRFRNLVMNMRERGARDDDDDEEIDDDGDRDGDKGRRKAWVMAGEAPKKSIQLFITEYYDNGSNWPPRPNGW